MPWYNRVREYSYILDEGSVTRAGESTAVTVENALDLGFSLVGSPTLPEFGLDIIERSGGQPFVEALPGPLPVANRRVEWALAHQDERLLRLGGRPYEYQGRPASGDTDGAVTAQAGTPSHEFRTIERRSTDNKLRVVRREYQGGIDPVGIDGLTGADYASMQVVMPQAEYYKKTITTWQDPDETLDFGAAGNTIMEVELDTLRYIVNGWDLWAGLKNAAGL